MSIWSNDQPLYLSLAKPIPEPGAQGSTPCTGNMNKIPKKLREELAEDPFYKTCCITGDTSTREDPIQWHHNLIYAGKQVQQKFCILPIKASIHEKVSNGEIADLLDWVMLNRASVDELHEFSKVRNLSYELKVLNRKFGVWKPRIDMNLV
jgi:hypothetical protein